MHGGGQNSRWTVCARVVHEHHFPHLMRGCGGQGLVGVGKTSGELTVHGWLMATIFFTWSSGSGAGCLVYGVRFQVGGGGGAVTIFPIYWGGSVQGSGFRVQGSRVRGWGEEFRWGGEARQSGRTCRMLITSTPSYSPPRSVVAR